MKTNLINNRQIRVFISSTFQDMQDERDYLMKRTFPKLRKLAAERDVTLTELDLRWGITEEESKSGKVVEICLREIENSIPFFIGIIGNRYGWMPEKKDIGENVTERFKDVNNYLKRHLSVTEMEMQFGVLQRKEDMHAYFYIKEGEAKENADNPEMLERLKKEVKASRYPSSTYSSPEDLAQQVEKAFTALLDQLFPEGHLSELEKERIGQRSFMNQLCLNYIRDDKNFQVLDEWMDNWEQHQLVVTGASGLGKSALIANWVKEKLSDENRGYNIIFHFTGNGGSESSHEHIIKTLIDEINDVYGWEANDEMNKHPKDKQDDRLNDLFIKVASEGKKPLLIVLDAINQIVDTENAKLLNWLPIPPKNIKILFSTLEDDRTMEVFQNRHYPTFILQPISTEHRRQLINTYLGWFSKKLSNKQVERIVNDRQCENTLALKTLLDELINFGVYEKLDERIEYYLSKDTIEGFYQSVIWSHEEEFGKTLVKKLLSLIALSKKGMAEEELIAISKTKPLYWSQFYNLFASHLIIKNGLVTFSHDNIRHAVESRYTKNVRWTATCRKNIVTYFEQDDNNKLVRSFEELAFQYYNQEKYDSLYQFLLTVPVFTYLYNHNSFELANYWRTLRSKGFEFETIREAIASAEQIDKNHYLEIISFSKDYMALYSFALLLCQDCKSFLNSFTKKNSLDTAKLYNIIGRIYHYMYDTKKALYYYLKDLEITEKELGKEHLHIADSFNNIGSIYCDMGDYPTSLKYHFMALEIYKKIKGRNHTKTGTSYDNIGAVYHYMGNYHKALQYYCKGMYIREKELGKRHPHTAESYNNIGGIYSDMKDHSKALNYYFKAMQIMEQVWGEKHPNTATTYCNIGVEYQGMGDYSKSLEYQIKSLEIRKEVLRKGHPHIAQSYNNIGIIYQNKGDYLKAIEYHLKDLEISEKILEKSHPQIATTYNNIGLAYSKINEYSKALKYHVKALKIRKKVLGTEHPYTATSYDNIGFVYSKTGDYPKALEYYLNALEIWGKVKDADNLHIGLLYNKIGYIYDCMEDYPKALDFYQKAMEIHEKELGIDHPKTAIIYNSISEIYSNMNDYSKVLEYDIKVLKSFQKMFGIENNFTSTAYNNVGATYRELKQFGKAIEYITKAYDIAEKLGDDIEMATYLNRLGRTYAAMGDVETARVKFQAAINLLPNNHPEAVDCREKLNNIQNKE